MGYVDFDFYSEIYCGTTVGREEFPHYEKKASKRLGAFINEELDKVSEIDEVKFAICEICDILCSAELHSGIEYERNDGYWVSYEDTLSTDERIKSCAKSWLMQTGLLYRGRLCED